ncbi:MAG: hypothetical protein K0S41_523 [Anaerocolumna sp.]|jgi:hypothetical protein|nr:hypothetical protein [Anaerocolumna sp.]
MIKKIVILVYLLLIVSLVGCSKNQKNSQVIKEQKNLIEKYVKDDKTSKLFQFDGFPWGTTADGVMKYYELDNDDINVEENEQISKDGFNYISKWINIKDAFNLNDWDGKIYKSYWFYNGSLSAGYYHIFFSDKEKAKNFQDSLYNYLEEMNLKEYKNHEYRDVNKNNLTISDISQSDNEINEESSYLIEIRVKVSEETL